MEQMKKGESLKSAFMATMLTAVCVIAALSAVTIWGCGRLQTILLPDPNAAYLHMKTTDQRGIETETTLRLGFGQEGEEVPTLQEQIDGMLVQISEGSTTYSIEKIERSYDSLTSKRKAAYTGLSVCKILLPAVYSVIGTLLSALLFYRRKLDRPISILAQATENIAAEDLDFTVSYESRDEMGRLCQSFETMRQALRENSRILWSMLEERRILQASLAHDLRNPITIIEGYTEYMQQKSDAGSLTEEKLRHILAKISQASKRLTRYTESIQDIQRLEDLELVRAKGNLPELFLAMAEDFVYAGKQKGIGVEVEASMEKQTAFLDQQVLFRILENLFSNGVRFAESALRFRARTEGGWLIVSVEDDGPGFPEEVLRVKNRYNLSIRQEGSHMGIGLIISRILCEKHGGSLVLSNLPEGGACAEVRLPIEEKKREGKALKSFD